MAATARPGRPRTATETARGLGALLLIAALLVGIPAGLLAVAGQPPLPSTIPGLDDLVAAITRPDDGALLVAALTWIGWLGWVTLAVSIAVEIPAAARGVRAPQLPALGPQQRLAAGLVAAAALLFTAGPASLAASHPAHADTTATAAAESSPVETSEQAEHAPPGVHLVEHGDTLWDIAGAHLGSGHRYPELYEASKDTTQPDGRRLIDPNLIHPGWEITIPAQAEPADPDGGPSVGVNVDSHVAPTRGEPPTTPAPTHDIHGAHPDLTPTNPGLTPGAPMAAEPDHAEPPSLRPTDRTTGDDAATEPPGEDDGAVDGCTVGGIGAALAGGLLFYLGSQRAWQHRHRKPGQRIALPIGAASQLENELRSVHDPLTLDLVNRALRTLAARCAVTGIELPAVRFARLIGGQLELHLAAPADVPAPFTPTVSPTLWALDPDGDILDADQADDYPAPYPSMVTVGHDADGGLILINLEHVCALSIDGGDTATAEMLGGIAAELATSLWSDDVRATTVGAAPELADVLDSGRIRHLDGTDPQQVDQLLDEMTARAAADRAALGDVDVTGLAAARPAGVAEGIWAPEILLIGAPMTSAQHDRLTELVHAQPRVAVAAVTTAATPLTEWTIRLHPSEADHAIVDPVGLGIRTQRLSPQDYAGLVDLLRATRAEPTIAAPSWRVNATGESVPADLPDEPERAEPDIQSAATTDGRAVRRPPALDAEDPSGVVALAGSDGAPQVAVLGLVEIHHAPDLAEPNKRGQLTALAAYLTLNPGQTRNAVDEAMWPGRRVSLATRNTAMTKLRNWLGADPDGTDYVPRATSDGYRLHPAVRTDWHQFTELLPDGPSAAPTDSLIAALNLVRDQPFKGGNPRRYIWAERIQQEMIAAIGDVADELARRALRAGDHRLALRAVMAGLVAEPGSEVLWRHRLRAHHAANDREALDQAADQLTALADDLGGDLEDETTELLTRLLSPVRAGQPATTTRRIR